MKHLCNETLFMVEKFCLQQKSSPRLLDHQASIELLVFLHAEAKCFTLKCLSIGTPEAINFPFISNEKLMFLGVPVFKHNVMRL